MSLQGEVLFVVKSRSTTQVMIIFATAPVSSDVGMLEYSIHGRHYGGNSFNHQESLRKTLVENSLLPPLDVKLRSGVS